jgi:hypothetical protein
MLPIFKKKFVLQIFCLKQLKFGQPEPEIIDTQRKCTYTIVQVSDPFEVSDTPHMKFLQTYMPKYRPTGARAFCVDIMQKN